MGHTLAAVVEVNPLTEDLHLEDGLLSALPHHLLTSANRTYSMQPIPRERQRKHADVAAHEVSLGQLLLGHLQHTPLLCCR